MKWNLEVTKPARKELQKLAASDASRIKAALISMGVNPFSGDVKRLTGQSLAWRRRVGSYRILYDLYPEKHLIVVTAIMRRTSTTY